jgi:hypothetical protein
MTQSQTIREREKALPHILRHIGLLVADRQCQLDFFGSGGLETNRAPSR